MKLSLSKTSLWILGIGLFIIVAAVLLALQASRSGDAKQLEDSLVITQTLLTKLSSDKEGLDNQLAQLKNQLDQADTAYTNSQANFPEAVASIEYDEELFFIADDYNLEVTKLTASEPIENKVDEVSFANTVIKVEVQGEVPDILSFINNVATGGFFNSATIELVNLKVPKPDEDKQPSAVIEITVYSYEGE
jgi:hypothetical protein